MKYNPSSLFEICVDSVRKTAGPKVFKLKDTLPATVYNEILKSYFVCDEEMDDEEVERLQWVHSGGWNRLLPMSTEMFVKLMTYPANETPFFAHEYNHIIYDCYIWKDNGIQKKICAPCYASVGLFWKQWSGNYWRMNRWEFSRLRSHDCIEGDELMSAVIWSPSSWCERCFTEPLIVDILDKEECRQAYSFHPPPHFMDSDESDEDTDVIMYNECKKEVGRFIDETMFRFLNKNGDIEP